MERVKKDGKRKIESLIKDRYKIIMCKQNYCIKGGCHHEFGFLEK